MNGPVKIVALGPARPSGLRSCGCEVPRIGPPALSPPPPSPSRARALHRATGRLTVSGKGSAFGAGRAADSAARAPRIQPEFCHVLGDVRGAEELCFAVNPERPNGVRGQNRNLSLISVAERNQHRHSMTPGRLAAVKDRGCPPILACGALRLASKNRLPPRPLFAAAARSRRRP